MRLTFILLMCFELEEARVLLRFAVRLSKRRASV